MFKYIFFDFKFMMMDDKFENLNIVALCWYERYLLNSKDRRKCGIDCLLFLY